MRAQDVMTSPAVTVTPDSPLQDVVQVLLDHRVSAVPVVDADGRAVGIVSEGDLIRRAELGTQRESSWWLRLLRGEERLLADYIRDHGRRARDVMSAPVVSVQEDASITDVAALLEKHRVKRVPVLRNGRVAGVVSRADLVRALATLMPAPSQAAEDDQELRHRVMRSLDEIRQPTSRLHVATAEGRVHVWGAVVLERERDAIRIAVEEVVPPERLDLDVRLLSEAPPKTVRP